MDLAKNTVARLADGTMPERVRAGILEAIRQAERATQTTNGQRTPIARPSRG